MIEVFCNNTKEDILKELLQWTVDGEIDSDQDLAPGGSYYLEAQSEIQSALLQGGFSSNYDSTTPIACNYIGAIHKKLTALLYIQAHRLSLLADGGDSTRGLWGSVRRKLESISRGEAFGELAAPKGAAQVSYFYGEDLCRSLSCNRGL